MDAVTLDRDEWAAVARELDTAYRESAPPGLRARVTAMLSETPAGWGDQACTLDLDTAAADVVRHIVRRGRGLPEHAGLRTAQDQAVQAAGQIVRDHGDAANRYRVEHRSEGRVVVIARTSAGDARQAELSEHAARLIAAGATGELVLVDEATGDELARRHLRPDPAPDQSA